MSHMQTRRAFQFAFVRAPALGLATAAAAQRRAPRDRQDEPLDDRLPNGRSRTLGLIKNDHRKSLEDVARILDLARDLEERLERNTEHVVSLEAIETAAEIERLSKGLQKRLKRVR